MGQKQDEAAFETFVRVSGPSLLRTALLLTGDRGHAEDVVQIALERVARRWSRLEGDAEAYTRRAVINAANDRHRRRRARPAESCEVSVPELSTHGADGTRLIDLRDALMQALRALPYRQRSVIICRYVLDLDERETALALGVGLGTVKASASRGLAALRALAPQLDLIPNRTEPPA